MRILLYLSANTPIGVWIGNLSASILIGFLLGFSLSFTALVTSALTCVVLILGLIMRPYEAGKATRI